MKLSIKLIESGNEFIARCPELDINCYGTEKKEAIRRIKDVLQFYLDSAKELGMEVENLNEIFIIEDELNYGSLLNASFPKPNSIN